MSDRLSIRGHDLRRISPADALSMGCRRAWEGYARNRIYIAIGTIVLTTLVAYLWITTPWSPGLPGLPNWLLTIIIGTIIATIVFAPYGVLLTDKLYHADEVPIVEVSAKTGNVRIGTIDPMTWRDVRIVDQNGVERDKSYLQQITVNGREAYEVDCYDADSNRAVASWMAGATNAQIRRHAKSIDRAKTAMERDSNKALEMAADYPGHVRDGVSEIGNHLIRVLQADQMPSEESLSLALSEAMEDAEQTSDLLSDRIRRDQADDPGEIDDGAEQDDDERSVEMQSLSDVTPDIFERAQRGEPADD